MVFGQKFNNNKPLFSRHYLQYHLPDSPEWQEDLTTGFTSLKHLYLSQKAILPTLNEAQTEDIFIKPVLDILGFSYIPQTVNNKKRPDYSLFTSQGDRTEAYSLQKDESAFYGKVKVIAEAKYWERSLSKVSANDQPIYGNENPSFQIVSYLIGTGVDWGILTNGKEWRLYYRQASSTATEFYQIDLAELLASDDLESFKYFWLFFRAKAFIKDVQGRNFLERVRDGSITYATRVGDELKALVFDRIFPDLATGFILDVNHQKKTVTAMQIYEATLSFLYKILFLLYAEARNLLPIENDDYRKYSLIQLTQEIAQDIDRRGKLGQTSTGIYDRVFNLYRIIDQGDPALEVPCYNGGLFHFDFSLPADSIEYSSNYFLSKFKLPDAVLAPVLDQLARFEGQAIDYSFLGVRQLGSIYEGLLEYRLVIDDLQTGLVHLENDKGERKATGSYYTPDYIVKYIVSNTLQPILLERQARFAIIMTQIAELHKQMQDQRLGKKSLQGLQKDLQRLEQQAQKILLDIKICDPAMGSGHFLVEAVDYLTDQLIEILSKYPDSNPVFTMLEQTKQSILANLAKQGVSINPERLEPTQLLQRVVMKRCIYGVDLNPMAVELAKVSLWLHSFTVGAPLSFLDHHLRCGNSLIGTMAKEAEANMRQETSGQLNLLTGPFVGLLKAAEIMRGVSILSDATFAEVEESERLFRAFDQAAQPYKRLLDIYVAQYFGVKQATSFLQRFGTDAITADLKKMKKADRQVYEDAQKISEEKLFFHWDLEFPEVFIDLEKAGWDENGGFDLVIGNPPYVRPHKLDADVKSILRILFAESYQAKSDILNCFLQLGLGKLKNQGQLGMVTSDTWRILSSSYGLREFILEKAKIETIGLLPYKVFQDATVQAVIIHLLKESNFNYRNNSEITVFDIIEEKELAKYPQNEYFSHPDKLFFIIPQDQYNIYQKMKNLSITIESICDVNFGLKTGDDRKFIKNYLQTEYDKKLVNSGSISRYSLCWSGSYVYYVPIEMKRHRSTARPGTPERFETEKLIISRMSKSLSATFDTENYYVKDALLVHPASKYNLYFICAIINSNLLNSYYNSTFTTVDLHRNELLKLPICQIDFTTTKKRRQSAVKKLIALYEKYQKDSKIIPLLAQVNNHLNQEPIEADVIHDLLAYLAEQMIDLNKQKQTEIRGFLSWLERFIGCPIDSLTNKSKIQNYLGDYYQDEPHLTFDQMIDIFKKNQKKLKIDAVARKEQETLAKEYQASLDNLLPIKLQLMQCDRLIDQIIYRLYRLTEDEIAIVEGKESI
jgi:type I restriction-modification system DNA methylase subunit